MFRVQIDRSLCSGFGSCVDAAPELFRLGDDGIAVALVEESDAAALLDAARSCPMGAIALLDEQGQGGGMSRAGCSSSAPGSQGAAALRCSARRASRARSSWPATRSIRPTSARRSPRSCWPAGATTSPAAHGFWREREIDLRLETRVRRIDVGRRLARTSARPIRWDALVLATGAHPRRLPALDGRPGVHALRTRADAEALAPPSARVVAWRSSAQASSEPRSPRRRGSSAWRSPCSRPATRRSRRSSGRRSGASLPSATAPRGWTCASARGLRG